MEATAIAKNVIRALLPLWARKRLAVWVQAQDWLNTLRRRWWVHELIRDLSDKDVNVYHKFLWRHHLGYAAPYEVETRFRSEQIRGSRHLFFADLMQQLHELGIDPQQIRSIFEVGCSLGYQLRLMEVNLFPHAEVLRGIDIDEYAVRKGRAYLHTLHSKVEIACGDMQWLDRYIGNTQYDIVLCAGVLMYLQEAEAAEVVRRMLARARVLVAMTGLAHPQVDNATLPHSAVRSTDHTFIHNLDRMVELAGRNVSGRRWEGSRQIDGQTIYFVFAAPASFGESATVVSADGLCGELDATPSSRRRTDLHHAA